MKRCLHCHTQFDAANWTCPACAAGPEHTDGFPLLAPALAKGGGGFRPEAFEQLAALEAKNFWFRARNHLIVWSIQKHFPNLRRYLEIGCGTGFVLAGVAQAFPAASLVGSELFQVGLPFAASRVHRAELIQMDARCIPYADEFDLIGAFDVLEHIEEDVAVLAAMHKALKPGGGIILTVPQHPWLWSAADEHACHVRRYTADELCNKVIGAGFNVEFETSFVSLLLPAMLTSRLGKKRLNPQDDPLVELHLPGWLNTTFETIMSLERHTIQHGWRFPWGGSRLLIAKKER